MSKWIQGAIKHPGSFTAAAKRAGKSVGEYAQEEKHAGGTLGHRARLAITLRKLAERRKHG
jgi:hypothetical protein